MKSVWMNYRAGTIGGRRLCLKRMADMKGIAVIGPVDHQVLLSICVFDPTSNCRLELTTPLTHLSDQDTKDAEQALDQWEV